MANTSASTRVRSSHLLFQALASLTILSCLVAGFALIAPLQQAKAVNSPYTLTIDNQDPALPADFIPRAQGVFDYSYPLLIHRFGRSTPVTNVHLIIDPTASTDNGVAWASGDTVRVASTYWKSQPTDFAWFTHELTHITQNYTWSAVPGWFTEGMADYSRYYYAPAGSQPSWWVIPGPPSSTNSYTEGYGTAARFLLWLEQRKNATIVDQLNQANQNSQSFDTLFAQLAGGTVDQVWAQYVADPTITLNGPVHISSSPIPPVVGQLTTIFYSGSLATSATSVTMHWGYNSWTSPTDTTLTKTNGIWQADITVPTGATVLDFSFKDQSNTVDNNGGTNYHLSTSGGVSTPTPTPTPTPSICSVSYQTSSWSDGFTANITITNTGSTAINGWTLTFAFPGTQQITQSWGSTYTQTGNQVSLTNVDYNTTIQPGQTATPGFNASWSGSNPNPTSFKLNGSTCSIV